MQEPLPAVSFRCLCESNNKIIHVWRISNDGNSHVDASNQIRSKNAADLIVMQCFVHGRSSYECHALRQYCFPIMMAALSYLHAYPKIITFLIYLREYLVTDGKKSIPHSGIPKFFVLP